MRKKICTNCKKQKNINEYTKHSSSRDGLSYFCRDCRYLKWQEYYSKNKKKRIASTRNWQINNKTKRSKYNRKDDVKKRLNANQRVFIAMKNGKIKKKKCEVCGEKKTEAHHDDYNKPLKIRWLCIKCHRKLHKSYACKKLKSRRSPQKT